MQVRRNQSEEFGVSNLELFFDLVFVFAITQVSHLLLENLDWRGALEAGMALLVVWWAWQYTVWAANEFDTEAVVNRLLLMVIMLASLLMAIAVPEAFGDRGLLFAGAYVFIQVGRHSIMTFVAADPGTVERNRAAHILAWFCFSALFWIGGAFIDGDARILVWLAALAIDYGGPLVAYRVPGMRSVDLSDWSVASDHFTERFQAFTIIALGESIVLTGATTAGLELDLATVATFVAAFVTTVCLWWLYFNYVYSVFARMLAEAEVRTLIGRDLYTYGHIPIIAAIILCAVGDELVIAHPGDALGTAALVAVTTGPLLYLLAYVPIRLRMVGMVPKKRLAGAACVTAIGLIAAATSMPAGILSGLLTAVLVGVVIVEARSPRHPSEPTLGQAAG